VCLLKQREYRVFDRCPDVIWVTNHGRLARLVEFPEQDGGHHLLVAAGEPVHPKDGHLTGVNERVEVESVVRVEEVRLLEVTIDPPFQTGRVPIRMVSVASLFEVVRSKRVLAPKIVVGITSTDAIRSVGLRIERKSA